MNNQHITQNTIQWNKLNVEGIFLVFVCSFGLSVFVEICCFVVVVVCLFVVVVDVCVLLLFAFLLFLFFVVGLIVCWGWGGGGGQLIIHVFQWLRHLTGCCDD